MTKVLFFASLKEQLQCASMPIDMEEPMQLSEFLKLLAESVDNWQTASNQTSLLYAINQEMVTLDAIVSPGDEVAIFPPVTGG